MFGISREEYERERDARVRAETLAETLRAENERLRAELTEERGRVADLLDRALPKPADQTMGWTGTGDGPARLTHEQVMSIPAVGRRGVRQRNHAALAARQRDEQAEQNHELAERRAALTQEEERNLEESLK